MDLWAESQSIPPLRQLLAESRYTMAVQYPANQSGQLAPVEIVVTIEYFRDKLKEVYERKADSSDQDCKVRA